MIIIGGQNIADLVFVLANSQQILYKGVSLSVAAESVANVAAMIVVAEAATSVINVAIAAETLSSCCVLSYLLVRIK